MSQPPLNSVERFRKQPGRLVLEEHGHCEVPAGCGGVVLRWRSPTAPRPVTVFMYTPVAVTVFLDGAELRTSRPFLAPGRHVLAVAFDEAPLSAGLLMVAAVHAPDSYQRVAPAEVLERPWKLLSEDDGTWKFTLRQPAGDWASPSFDDSGWLALVQVPTPTVQRGDHGAYACGRAADQGAACLGLPRPAAAASGRVWVRKVFELPAPEGRQPQPPDQAP